jgi:hypothetical protein
MVTIEGSTRPVASKQLVTMPRSSWVPPSSVRSRSSLRDTARASTPPTSRETMNFGSSGCRTRPPATAGTPGRRHRGVRLRPDVGTPTVGSSSSVGRARSPGPAEQAALEVYAARFASFLPRKLSA